MAKLVLINGPILQGETFGAEKSVSGEVVFQTGMTGYPQAFTDPSYAGQILVLTYPLVGNYGVPDSTLWESYKPHIRGLIVSTYNDTPSHYQSKQTLGSWLKKFNIPALVIKDTRILTKHIREHGVGLGKIINTNDVVMDDPNFENIVDTVSTKKVTRTKSKFSKGKAKTVVVIDCGAKKNIQRCFHKRGVDTVTVPWDFDPFTNGLEFDALFISNGPGDPKNVGKTIATVKKALQIDIPILGICLGNQVLALAAGGDTYKLKYGHRSQNQPCRMQQSDRCYITTQNHGYAIGKVPDGFNPWFINQNDNTIEGIIHKKQPFMAVQFHPEASPGPVDTEWIFDYFLNSVQ